MRGYLDGCAVNIYHTCSNLTRILGRRVSAMVSCKYAFTHGSVVLLKWYSKLMVGQDVYSSKIVTSAGRCGRIDMIRVLMHDKYRYSEVMLCLMVGTIVVTVPNYRILSTSLIMYLRYIIS
jgi:hypothetical protein